MNGKQLKNSILQWAIQGKLVPQNPKDEPASKLLERLKKFHTGLKPCKESVNLSAMEFSIPNNWEMIELDQLFNFVDYRGKTPNKINNGIFLITSSNIKQGYMDYTRKEYISKEEYEGRKIRGVTKKGDLLFTTEAPMGNAALCDLDECSCGQRIITLQEYTDDTLLPKLFMYFLLSPSFQMELLDNCTGTTAKGIKAEKLKHLLIPLPPLAEQKRIVKKLEQILPLVDEYDQAQTQLDKLNKELPEALKKSILQQAIQGKLVPQNPKDEPADKLLERITISRHSEHSEEYSKKSRKSSSKYPVSRIYRDTDGLWYEQIGTSVPKDITEEIPFEIPETWTWCRLNYVCDIARGGSPRPIQEYLTDAPDGLNWIKIGDTEKGGKYINSTKEKIKPEGLKKTRMIHKGDFLLTNSMSFGRPYISNIDGCIHDGWLVISMLGESFYPDYLYYLLSSQYAYNQFCGKVAGAVVKNLNSDKVAESIIPLPPLAEQKRIVAKLEQLFKAL